MYVCKYVCMYVCMYVYIYIRPQQQNASLSLTGKIYVCMDVCMYVCMDVFLTRRNPTNHPFSTKRHRPPRTPPTAPAPPRARARARAPGRVALHLRRPGRQGLWNEDWWSHILRGFKSAIFGDFRIPFGFHPPFRFGDFLHLKQPNWDLLQKHKLF